MGLIRDSNQVKQAIDFEGLEYSDKIHPSDIDCVLEFDDTYLILIEVKKKDNPLLVGQELLLTRICNAWCENPKRKAAVLKVEHQVYDGDIPIKDCVVRSVYMEKEWDNVWGFQINLPDYLNKIANYWGIEKMVQKKN